MLQKKTGSYFEHFVAAMLVVVVLATSLSCQKQSNGVSHRPVGENGPQRKGGPDAPKQMIVGKFDQDDDGKLNAAERSLARKYLETNARPPRRRPRRGSVKQGQPGPAVGVDDARKYSSEEFYDPTALRTIFLEFEQDDWEQELAIFKPTDVEVPAKMTVDGVDYPKVGVRFRGASSFFTVPDGLKRSLNISMDYDDQKQNLLGYTSLNLLNCNGDDSLMSSALYSYIASQRIATPKTNFVKVVINGHSWGVYANSQQFNKQFLQENFETTKGNRWKVPGSPHGDGGLRYLGEDVEEYRARFELKSKENDQAWQDLIHLCKVLNQTPVADLENALAPILDIDGALWFLAVDVATSNSDGYWARASDYSIYQSTDGKFHILPYDMNEAFQSKTRRGPPGMGRPDKPPHGPPPPPGAGPPPGARGPGIAGSGPPIGREPGGVELDPLIGLDRAFVPLRSKLLSNPRLQQRYLQHLHTIATDLLNWESVGPRVEQMRELIEEEVLLDTRKLMTNEAFLLATSSDSSDEQPSLRRFCDARTRFLLDHEKLRSLPETPIEVLANVETESAGKPQGVSAALPRGESPVVISEVMANNQSSVADQEGDYDDWIELHNRGETAVDLSSHYLTDDETVPQKWKFPPDSTISAGGFLLVWADNDSEEAGLHANFKLSREGETITLSNDEFLLDTLRFPATKTDKSFGKFSPAGEETGEMKPTPGEKNVH